MICTDTSIDQEIVSSLLEKMDRHIKKLSRTVNEEYEEVFQQAALFACEHGVEKGSAYVYCCLRNHYYKHHARSIKNCCSLETPIPGTNEDILLANVIAYDDSHSRRKATNEQRIAALYTALACLPLEEQEYYVSTYHIEYVPCAPLTKMKSGKPGRDRHAIGQSARYHLRKLMQV